MSTQHHKKARQLLADRSVIDQPSRNSFSDWENYTDTLAVGTAAEQEISEKEETAPFISQIVLIEQENGDDDRFIAIFRPPRHRAAILSAGDLASAFLILKQERVHGRWDLRVLPPIPSARNGLVAALIERRRDQGCQRNSDFILPFTTGLSGSDARETVAQLTKLLTTANLRARITPQARHSIFCYVFEGLSNLEKAAAAAKPMAQDVTRLLLLGAKSEKGEVELTKVRKYDIYGSLSDISLASEDGMNLNDSQKQAIRLGRSAPAGFVLCHGGPGTGKTHFVIQAVTPFLRDRTRPHRVLLTSAGNRGADAMAEGLHRQLQQMMAADKMDRDCYVLRLHSIKTERAIALKDAEKDRKMALARKFTQGHKGQQRQQPSTAQPNAILAHCQTFAACKFEGVADERVQNLELSLGHRMLQVAGMRPAGELAVPEPPGCNDFRVWYEKYRNGDVLGEGDQANFDAAIDALMGYTIRRASAVCATASGAADSTFTSNYQDAELIVVDEAARLPEYQWWPLLGLFPNAIGKIMVGDPNQLRPVSESKGELTNPFQRQMETSLQARLQALGFESAFFTIQYRAVPQIAAIYNVACYKSQLADDASALVSARPLGQAIVCHNQKNYGMATSVIFYNAPNPKEGRAYSGSKYCLQYAVLVLRILEDLVVAGFGGPDKPCSIAILTPYDRQDKLLRIGKAKMAEKYSAVADVVLETVGKVQGIEYDIVIADPVAVTSPGFLDKHRLNVLFSRAKMGLYVVGHGSSWSKMWKDDSLMLRRFGKELKKYHVSWPTDQTLSSPFFDPDVYSDDD